MALQERVQRIGLERNLPEAALRAAFRDFLEALHEVAFKASAGGDCVDIFNEVRFTLGSEATYHLVGLVAGQRDDSAAETEESMRYIDPTAVRFRTIVDRWEMEIEQFKEADS